MKKIFLAFSFLVFTFCNSEKKEPNSKIKIYDNSIESIIDISAEIEIIADSVALPEGPVWDEKSNSLYFSDVISNKIFRWNELNGTSEFIVPSGNTGYAPNLGEGILGANGLALDIKGNLILCQHGDRRIAMLKNMESDIPKFETIVDNFEGKTLNSPNDITLSKDGTMYFTDPPFAFFDAATFSFVETEMRKLNFNGVFKYNPDDNTTTLITKDIDIPNGIALSEDEKSLYVNKMGILDNSPAIKKINLETNEVKTFFDGKDLFGKVEGNFDGMKVHSSGHVFTSGPGGLLVISPSGKLKAKIDFGHITNCAFDKDEKYLYATGFLSNPKVYRVKLK